MNPDEKLCPDCAEVVKVAARKCKHCGLEFAPTSVPANAPAAAPLSATPPVPVAPPCLESGNILDLLTHLVDKNLAVYEEDENGQGRYHLLETVRQYARERLLDSGASKTAQGRHRDWFAEYAVRMDSLLSGPESDRWWGAAEPEYPNLRMALEWSLAHQDEQSLEAALRLLRLLAMFWRMRGNVSEGREVYASILVCVRESAAATPALAKIGRNALHLAGNLANRQGDFAAARAFFEEALHLSQERGDRGGATQALNNLGYVAMYEGDLAAARAYIEEALQVYQASGDPIGTGSALYSLGHVADAAEQYDQARAHYEEALAIWRNHPEGQNGVRYALLNLGHGARRTGDFARARSHYEESLRRFVAAGDRRGVAQALEGFASLAVREGPAKKQAMARRAARLYGAADALREIIGTPLPAIARALHEEPMNAARAALGEKSFRASWAEGRAMTLEQAVAYALEDETP